MKNYFLCLVSLLVACSSQTSLPSIALPTETIIPNPSSTPVPSPIPTLAPSPTFDPFIRIDGVEWPSEAVISPLELENISGGELSAKGPWMILEGGPNLIIIDSAGGVQSKNSSEDYPFFNRLYIPSPTGGLVAFVDTENYEFTLHIFSFPNLEILTLMDLTPYFPDVIDDSFASEELEGDRYLSALGGPVWSRNGKLLAYIASPDVNPDLFLYSIEANEIKRISKEDGRALNPVWSPDDQYIFFEVVGSTNFGKSGAGYSDISKWAVNIAEGGEAYKLIDGLGYGYEHFIGWESSRTALIDSEQWWAGNFHLRTIDIESGVEEIIWCPVYGGRAYDPKSNQVLLYYPGELEHGPDVELTCEEDDLQPGLYLVSLDTGKIKHLQDLELENYMEGGAYVQIEWIPQRNAFWIEISEVMYEVTLTGKFELIPINPMNEWEVSSDGSKVLEYGRDGMNLYLKDWKLVTIETNKVHAAFWGPYGSAVYIISFGKSLLDVYVARPPTYELELLIEDVDIFFPGKWVMP
ncbi:MAG: hypothetical protein OEY93_11285 [Anaerolineae bacterium]|nr:hypothetical protein [Anaerolineae bacterium]